MVFWLGINRLARVKRVIITYLKCMGILLILSSVTVGVIGAAFSTDLVKDVLGERSVEIPIIMYHSIVNSTAKVNSYIITPAILEADLKYLSENGYTTILAEDLISFVNGQKDLPEKPVMLTFDDGFYNNYSYALPLLEKYDMKATVSILGIYTDKFSAINEAYNNNYTYLSWKQIKEMLATGRIDIGNHTYNMHGEGARMGIVQLPGESQTRFISAITEDILRLQDEMSEYLNYRAIVMTYPFGFFSSTVENTVKQLGFMVSFTCAEKVNIVTEGNPDSLFGLGRFNRPYGVSTYNFMRRIL